MKGSLPGTVLRALAVGALLVTGSCTSEGSGSPSSSPSASPNAALTPSPSQSPSATVAQSPSVEPAPEVLELRSDGLGGSSFGDPVAEVVAGLEALLGPPVEDQRRHGDMPLGFGGVDTTTRRLAWPGLDVLFQDWEGYYRDDGVLHLIGWVVSDPATRGIELRTPEGIAVGSPIVSLREAYGSELDVQRAECWGRVSFFWVGSGPLDQLGGSLNGFPKDPDALVTRLDAGAPKEGVAVC